MITKNPLVYIGVVYLALIIGTVLKFKVKSAPINLSTVWLAIRLPFILLIIITNDVIFNSDGGFFGKLRKLFIRCIFAIRIFPIIVGVLAVQIKESTKDEPIKRAKTSDIRGVYEDNTLRGFELVN